MMYRNIKMQYICIATFMSLTLRIFIAMPTNSTKSTSIGHLSTTTPQMRSSSAMFTNSATLTPGNL